jgi:hypothetical protein
VWTKVQATFPVPCRAGGGMDVSPTIAFPNGVWERRENEEKHSSLGYLSPTQSARSHAVCMIL